MRFVSGDRRIQADDERSPWGLSTDARRPSRNTRRPISSVRERHFESGARNPRPNIAKPAYAYVSTCRTARSDRPGPQPHAARVSRMVGIAVQTAGNRHHFLDERFASRSGLRMTNRRALPLTHSASALHDLRAVQRQTGAALRTGIRGALALRHEPSRFRVDWHVGLEFSR